MNTNEIADNPTPGVGDITGVASQASAAATASTASRAALVPRMPALLEPELDELQSDESEPASDVTDDVSGGVTDNIRSHGFVPFYRKLRQAWWFEHKPWSYAHLFLWLLLDANFKAAMRPYEGNIISVPRGAVLTSVLSLSKKSGLSRQTVRRFIKKMTDSGEIRTPQSGPQGIVLQLVRYDEYTRVYNRHYNPRYNQGTPDVTTVVTPDVTHLNKENHENQ
jgi:hypothetical protein